MKKFAVTLVLASATVGAALGFAGPASAAGGADAVINGLTADGYVVQLSVTPTAPLTACTVTDVQRDVATGTASLTAHVNVSCPDGC